MVNIFTFQGQTKSFPFYDSHSFFELDVEFLMNQLLHSISTFYLHDLKIKIGCNEPLRHYRSCYKFCLVKLSLTAVNMNNFVEKLANLLSLLKSWHDGY